MPEMPDDERKKLIAEAIDEWLDRKFSQFGKWSVRSLGAMAFSAGVYWIAVHGGK